eukprot:TRINITY_DN2170_c0_g1_i1.p1 TRINITY_DN2170_c0_g1~~TRINITY_DN2170_c0_g1_i1.p1  ORF type:complete len:256 (+),score=36.61 TRINITY_DN2170_c0_g1_i1:772-1539(+)
MDGVSFDFETIPSDLRSQFSVFLLEFVKAARAEFPGIRVTGAFDFLCTKDADESAYDMVVIGYALDNVIIMAYDMYSLTMASANSPYDLVDLYISQCLELGIVSSKLIIAYPWYGKEFACDELYDYPSDDLCKINQSAPGVGVAHHHTYVPQSTHARDHREVQVNPGVSDILYNEAVQNADEWGRQWSNETRSPYYTRWDTYGKRYQGWYDDALSLSYKYALAVKYSLGGVGVWTGSFAFDAPEMWAALSDLPNP